ncbi:MAG: hypothetical protein RLO80_03465 [Hyphomonas sp.]
MTNTNPALNRTLKILAVSVFGLATAMSAHASRLNDDFQVTFEFSRAQPAQDIYKSFEIVAEAACRAENGIKLPRQAAETIRKCQAELVEKAVKKAAMPALTDLHREKDQSAN